MSGPTLSPPTIRIGSNGLHVAYCQNLLNRRLSGKPCWVDGTFGGNPDTTIVTINGNSTSQSIRIHSEYKLSDVGYYYKVPDE